MNRCAPGWSGTATAPSGLAASLLDSALTIAELLVEQVIEPGLDDDDSADFTKEVTELAMLLRLVSVTGAGRRTASRVSMLARRIAPIARSSRVADRCVARPSQAGRHLLAHACLHQLGCRDDRFTDFALSLLQASAAHAEERVPYRLLDSGWTRHLLLGDAELAHPALAVSPIGRGVDLIATPIEDAYAFSHALPYATDFGRIPLPDWADPHWLSEIADALILQSLAEDDLDLLGELLMAPALLRLDWSPIQWFGWQVLVTAWQQYGFLPGPGLPAAEPGESSQARISRVLGTVYHTTLVGGLLVATLLRCGYWPPDEPPAGTAAVPSLPPLPSVPAADRAWHRCWTGLSGQQRSAVVAIPVGIALQQAVASTDVLGIASCLRGPWLAQLPGPLVSQSAELLNRLALLVG